MSPLDDTRWVRERHPDRPWEGTSSSRACICDAPGDPCPMCKTGDPPALPSDVEVDVEASNVIRCIARINRKETVTLDRRSKNADLREALAELVLQVERSGASDSIGHPLKNLRAKDAKRLLAEYLANSNEPQSRQEINRLPHLPPDRSAHLLLTPPT